MNHKLAVTPAAYGEKEKGIGNSKRGREGVNEKEAKKRGKKRKQTLLPETRGSESKGLTLQLNHDAGMGAYIAGREGNLHKLL